MFRPGVARRRTGKRDVHVAGRGSDVRGAPRRLILLRTNALASHLAQVLIILLAAIVALYVIVVLLGFAGIHVPVPGFR